MADKISVKVVTAATKRNLKELNRDVDAATKKGLRAVAAKVRADARKRAPVYTGSRKTVSVGGGKQIPLVPGELKKGIGASKKFKTYGNGTYGLTVGPRGGHVHLYALKQEKRTPFMAPAHEAVDGGGGARDIHEAAWAKETAKRRG